MRPWARRPSAVGAVASSSPFSETKKAGASGSRCGPGACMRETSTSLASKWKRAGARPPTRRSGSVPPAVTRPPSSRPSKRSTFT